MKKRVIILLFVSIFLLSCTSDKGDFKVVYEPVTDQNLVPFEQVFQESQLFEGLAESLNEFLILPHDLYIVLGECGQPNAFYTSEKSAIIMCYELMGLLAISFQDLAASDSELGQAMLSTMAFVFFHELGHALIDIYDIPATGREEDAVDQLSTFILAEGGEAGEEMVLTGATWFYLNAENTELSDSAFADEHSLDKQRFYNLACWIYGKDPGKRLPLVTTGMLPEARALRCPDEYVKLSISWDTLLKPYIKAAE